ncbi:YeeE/YedE family protein [Guyparkeria hydrothermalis]|uniref:YeeE/YedE family protein n=1 Tax=Guyparkeria hydrothermalis TaxID=923 RepID=UPI002021946C|nr:YeeE/YedE thiosulfate transporter family protein [Guyparkeria hydrothermalis]MCL7743628.1 YeeE/YedE family protein [Guyparkeria hydrothermalis]
MMDLLDTLIDAFFAPLWPPVLAGALIALLAFGQRWLADQPLSCSTGFANLATWLRPGAQRDRDGDWRVVFLLGIVLGGLLAALTDGAPAWQGTAAEFGRFYSALVPDSSIGSAVWWLVGGLMIGLGARLAGGCTSGHTIAGVAMGAPASIVASAVFFAVAVGSAQLAAWMLGV